MSRFSCVTQPESTDASVTTLATMHCAENFMALPSPVIGAPLCLITAAERKQFFEQLGIADSRRQRRLREVLVRREIGIRVGLDDVDLSIGVHAVVDARAAR